VKHGPPFPPITGRFPRHSRILSASARCFTLLAITAAPALADVVIIEAMNGPNVGSITPFPPFSELVGNWSSSSTKSSAPGTTATRFGAQYDTLLSQGPPSFKLQPTLSEAGGTYYVETTHGSGLNISRDIVVAVSTINASGLPAVTDAFQQANGSNSWYRIGTLTLDQGQTTPTLTFTYSSGNVNGTNGSGSRFYVDAFRFVNTNTLCASGLPEIGANGPLQAGQTSIDVAGVSALATNISLYADNVLIGQLSSGIVAGVNPLTTTPLVKGQQITAGQWADGVESCRPANGAPVGGGPNPRLRVALSIRQNLALTGPIGANGGISGGKLTFLGSGGVVSGIAGSAPSGGKVVYPSTCWQSVSFLRGADAANPVDPTYAWFAPDGDPLRGDFGVLEAIVFAIDDLTDTGPFQVYIDNVMNGTNVIQDFESTNAGTTTVLFTLPGFASSTTPFLLAAAPGSISPNASQVSDANADTGTNSALIEWQFKDTAPANWLRLTTQGSGTPNPQVDLRLPISFRILLLPIGQTAGKTAPSIEMQPISQNVRIGEEIHFSVHASPEDASYQWYLDGTPLERQTAPSYFKSGAQPADAGSYTVVISTPPGSCTITSQVAVLGLIGSGNGLDGDYYSNRDKSFDGPPTLSRLDSSINFNWGTSAPDPAISADHFTVRWSGQVQPLTSDTYTFYATTDDGVRLWVNGVKLIDDWNDQEATESSGSIAVIAYEKYDLLMEYYESTGNGAAQLQWSSATQPKGVIPQSQLYALRPSFTSSPRDAAIECGSSVTLSASAGGSGYLNYQWLKNGAAIPDATSSNYTINAAVCADSGIYTASASNGVGSSLSSPATVTILNIRPPAIACPSNISFLVCATNGTVVGYSVNASVDCNRDPVITCDPPGGSFFPLGTTVVNCTATDACGNTAGCQFPVQVMLDTTPPMIFCREDILQTAPAADCCARVDYPLPASQDSCDPSPVVRCQPPSGACFPVGKSTVSCTVVDSSGKTAGCSFLVWVLETTPPVLHCPEDLRGWTCSGESAAPVSYVVPAVDNCDTNVEVICVPPSGSFFPMGTNVVHCRGFDSSGNGDTCSFAVVVVPDSTPPLLQCPTNITVSCNGGTTMVSYSVSASDDADPSPSVRCDPPSGSEFPPGTNSVSCTTTDRCGHESDCAFTVTVVDLTPAVMTIAYSSDEIILSWPVNCQDYAVEYAASLNPAVQWTTLTASRIFLDGRYCVRLALNSSEARFYRLVSRP